MRNTFCISHLCHNYKLVISWQLYLTANLYLLTFSLPSFCRRVKLCTDASAAQSAQSAYTLGDCTGVLHSPVKKEHTCNINKNCIDIYRLSYKLLVMTDISKYRNVSLTHETYNTLKKLSKVLLPGGTPLSISKTVETLTNEKAEKLNGKIKLQKSGNGK